jgi:hypothetical protein
MNAQVIIIEKSSSVNTTANGVIGINPNNSEYGSIQMATTKFDFGNFASAKRVVHFMSGRVSDLENIVKVFDLKIGDDFSKKAQPSRIIVKESITPFYEGQKPKINPETSEIILHNGQEVYRDTDLVAASSQETDQKLSSDKVKVAQTESPFVETNDLSA